MRVDQLELISETLSSPEKSLPFLKTFFAVAVGGSYDSVEELIDISRQGTPAGSILTPEEVWKRQDFIMQSTQAIDKELNGQWEPFALAFALFSVHFLTIGQIKELCALVVSHFKEREQHVQN